MCYVPLIIDLKGITPRIGKLGGPVSLKQGDEFRFTMQKHIIGEYFFAG